MKDKLKTVALDALKNYKEISIYDLPAVIETIQKCYYTDSPQDEYIRQELQYFIDGLRK